MYHSDDDYGYWFCLSCGNRLYDTPAANGQGPDDYTRTYYVEPQVWRCAFRLDGPKSGFVFPYGCIWPDCNGVAQSPYPYCRRHQEEYAEVWEVGPPRWSEMNLGRPFVAEVEYLWDGEFALVQKVSATAIPIPKRERTLMMRRFRASVAKCLWMTEALREAAPLTENYIVR